MNAAPREATAPNVVLLDLAIVALDAALANRFSLSLYDVAEQLAGESAAHEPFPHDRFGEAVDGAKPLCGSFFTRAVEIDVDGFGMGPRPLSAIDPYKLLVAARMRRVVEALGVRGNERTGIVVCANLGGASFFDLYRQADACFVRGDGPDPSLDVDGVATLLPTMLSGYPALFDDVKGLHYTLSGGAQVFLTALLSASYWLARHCDTLLLAAGSYASSRADVQRLWRRTRGEVPMGEGLSVFALRRASALAGTETPLATLRAFVPAEMARSIEQAARFVGVDFVSCIEVCELDPNVLPAFSLQRRTGYLSEATGSEALLALVLRARGSAAIEIRDGGQLRGFLFVDVHRHPVLEQEPRPRLPLALRFSSEPSLAHAASSLDPWMEHLARVTENAARPNALWVLRS